MCRTVAEAREGQHPRLIAELRESFVMFAENQGSRGWCVLVLKEHADHLADLAMERQVRLWEEVVQVAAAQRRVFGPVRINYECLGNQVNHVHWHVIPRHRDDPMPRAPVWLWTEVAQKGAVGDAEQRELIAALRTALGPDIHTMDHR